MDAEDAHLFPPTLTEHLLCAGHCVKAELMPPCSRGEGTLR